MSVASVAPAPFLEEVPCYGCGDRSGRPFIEAQDDLTGKPGTFQFVSCGACGLTYQNPRVSLEHVKDFYDDEYIAHRKTNWGVLNKAFDRAMNQLDESKDRLVSRYASLDRTSEVLDVGCGVGTFTPSRPVRRGRDRDRFQVAVWRSTAPSFIAILFYEKKKKIFFFFFKKKRRECIDFCLCLLSCIIVGYTGDRYVFRCGVGMQGLDIVL